MSKITGYPPITNVQPNDVLITVDVNDDTMAPTGTDKKITLAQVHSPSVSSVDWINAVTQYGADRTGTSLNDLALANATAAAVAAGVPLYIPAGTYKISAPVNWKIAGLVVITAGSQNTTITQTTANTPVLQVAGQGQNITGLTLRYSSQEPSGNTSSIGIEFGDDTVGSCFMSYFGDLYFKEVNCALATNPAITTVAGVFSCLFEDIHILGFSYRAINFIGGNNVGAGDTGCVFNNVYINNAFSGTDTASSSWPVFFQVWSEVVFNQLNIEHMELSSDACVFAECGTVVINGLHLEHLELSGTPGYGLVGVGTGTGTVTVNGLSVEFCTLTGTSYNSLFRVTGGSDQNINLNGLYWPTSNAGGSTTPATPLVDFNSAAGVTVQITGIDATASQVPTKNSVNAAAGCILNVGTPLDATVVPSGDTSGAADYANITAAFAGGNTVVLGTGTWYLDATVGPLVTGQWIICQPGVFINWLGTGDCFRWTDSSTYTTRTIQGAGILGRPIIDGTSAGAGSTALHAGDILGFRFDIAPQNFTGTGDIAVSMDNQVYWTEQAIGTAWINNCTQDVVFNCGGASTSNGSFDRGDFAFYLSHKTFTGNCITWQNGAYQVGGRVRVYGNINSSGTTFTKAVFSITGAAPGGHTASYSGLQCGLDINLESDEALTYTFQTINFGSTNNTITDSFGSVNFGAGNQFTASNITTISSQFTFAGPVVGDTSLNETSLTGRLAVPSSASFFSSVYLGDIGSAPSTPTGGGYLYVDSSGNLHYLGPGGGNTMLAGLAPSGDTSGATDPGRIQALLNLGGKALLQPGTFYIGGSAALSLTVASGMLQGSGIATQLQILSGFSAAELISVAAASCDVRDLAIVGASSTLTSNPACNGIELNGYAHCRFENIWAQYVNGWIIESLGGSSTANLDTMIGRIVGRNCAAGVHVKGVSGSSYQGEHFLTDIQLQQMGASSGANANLDALLIEDVSDVLVQGVNIGIASGTTGGALHIKGACATVAVTNPDVGANAVSGGSAALHIESSTNGSPSGVTINGGSVEGGSVAIQVDAGSDVTLNGVRGHQAYGDGLQINGTPEVLAIGCSLAANNQGGGTAYDVNGSGMTGGNFRAVGTRLETAIGTGTPGEVPNSVSASTHMYFKSSFFIATGSSPSNVFTGTPQQVTDCVGYNPRGSVTAPSITTSPFTPGGYQAPLTVIFTAINSMISFAIGGVTLTVLPIAGVPYYIGCRESMTITWATTTVASGSNGGEISTIASWGATYGGNGVLDVASTTGWPTSGTVNVAASGSTTAVVTYTGISGNTLTGCAYVSGSATGTVSTGGAVTLASGAPTWQWFAV